jgi:glycosyltransferase involved in cell wall biosynthesis
MDRLITLVPADGILACSQTAADAQEALWPQRPTRIVHPCVDLDRFDPDKLPSPAEARRRLDLPEDGPLIGMVARLQRWKGVHVLIKAMPRILEQYPTAHAVIVGGKHDLEPDYPQALRDLISKLNLNGNITLAGFQHDVPCWMQAMDVVVHASDREPFGMVILEAMALGKPVVAGKQGGPREIISNQNNGLLAPYDDEEVLARQIRCYLNNPVFARDVGQQAVRRAQEFSPSHYTADLEVTVRELLSPQRSSHLHC